MRFVVVTGMSGGGKRTTMKMLEDMGFYCVDNLPVSLIEKFADLLLMPGGEIDKVALGMDVRSQNFEEEATKALAKLKDKGIPLEILFMDCEDETLIKRYKETRRVHPLSLDASVEEGIQRERKILESVRKKADYIIDSSNLLTRELREELVKIFVEGQEYNSLMVTVMSFGFKNGIPSDADLVFDVRFLPNPYYIEELRPMTGNDKPIQEYVMKSAEAGVFLEKLVDMLTFLIPNYVKEGKNRLVVAIGCTGGRHRSVTLANALYGALKDNSQFGMKLFHRDLNSQKG